MPFHIACVSAILGRKPQAFRTPGALLTALSSPSCLPCGRVCISDPGLVPLGTTGRTRLEQVFPTSTNRKYQSTKEWAKPGPNRWRMWEQGSGGGLKGCLPQSSFSPGNAWKFGVKSKTRSSRPLGQVNSPLRPCASCKNKVKEFYVTGFKELAWDRLMTAPAWTTS